KNIAPPFRIGNASTCCEPSGARVGLRCYEYVRPSAFARLGREGFSAATGLVGVRIDEFEIPAHQVLMKIELGPLQVDGALRVHDDLHAVEFIDLVVLADLFVEVDGIAQA